MIENKRGYNKILLQNINIMFNVSCLSFPLISDVHEYPFNPAESQSNNVEYSRINIDPI